MGTSSKCSPRCSVEGMLQLSVKLQSTSRHHFMNLGALLMQGLGLTQNSMPCKWTWVRAEGSWGSITPPSPLSCTAAGSQHSSVVQSMDLLEQGWVLGAKLPGFPPIPRHCLLYSASTAQCATEAQFGPPAQGSCSWAPEARVCWRSRWASRESRLQLYLFICLAGLTAIRRADLSPLANTSSCFSGTSCMQCHIPQAGGPGSIVGT